MTPATFCESCGRRASDDARFCGGCGRPFAGAPAAPAGAVPAGPREPGPTSAASAAPATTPGAEETAFEFRSVAVRTVLELVLSILTLGLVAAWLHICRRNVRYRITSQRVEIVSGLVTVTRRTVDLFRVHDLEIVEPFLLRMRGAGNLVIRSRDAGEPEVTLVAVPNVHAVHETLRGLVANDRRRVGVKMIEES